VHQVGNLKKSLYYEARSEKHKKVIFVAK